MAHGSHTETWAIHCRHGIDPWVPKHSVNLWLEPTPHEQFARCNNYSFREPMRRLPCCSSGRHWGNSMRLIFLANESVSSAIVLQAKDS